MRGGVIEIHNYKDDCDGNNDDSDDDDGDGDLSILDTTDGI